MPTIGFDDIHSMPDSAENYGATGDGSTDDTTALQNWANGGATSLYLGPGTYRITDTLTIPHGWKELNFGGGEIVYDGPQDRAAIVFGSTTTDSAGANIIGLRVESATQSDWTDADYTGVVMYNMRYGDYQLTKVDGFTTGVDMRAHDAGFGYNTIRLGHISNNEYGVRLYGSSGAAGFPNENFFLGGRFGIGSAINTSLDAYGVVFAAASGGYVSHNNNVFEKCVFELQDGASSSVKRIPFLFDGAGTRNYAYNLRMEGGRGPIAILDGTGVSVNVFHVGQLIGDHAEKRIEQVNGAVNNFIQDMNPLLQILPSWHSGPLADQIKAYNSARATPTGDLHLFQTAAVDDNSTGVEVLDDCVRLNGRGVGTFLDTSARKEFVVQLTSQNDRNGRVVFNAYDEDMNHLGNSSDYVFGSGISTTAGYGGGFWTGNDSYKEVYFSVTDAVKYVRVGLVKGSNPAEVKSFSITGAAQTGGGGIHCFSGLDGHRALPTALGDPSVGVLGSYKAGDLIQNGNAASGNPAFYVCTTSGHLAKAWTASTAVSLGELREDSGSVYVCRTAGTTGSTAPTGTGTGITDGTAVWDYKGSKAAFTAGPNLP